MDFLGHKLLFSLQDVRNLADEENNYIPECDSKFFLSPDLKHEFVPIYNLVIVEEGYSPLKIFDHLNKRIGKPTLYSEDFIKLSRNSYLVKVTKVDQGYCLQGKKDFKNSEIFKIIPYNGSKGKIYNNDLAKLDKQELLDRCPTNITDAFNIMVCDPTLRKRINSLLFMLNFSDSIPPDTITIGPYIIKVQNYQATPRICFKCLNTFMNLMIISVLT